MDDALTPPALSRPRPVRPPTPGLASADAETGDGTSARIGDFSRHGDVGAPRRPGDAVYDPQHQTYMVSGAGHNVWHSADQFHFVHRRLTGDFILQARGGFRGAGVNPHRKFGLMLRAGLETDAPHVNAVVHGDGLTSLQFRRCPGVLTEELQSAVTAADVIQLERRGQRCLMSVARHGEALVVSAVADVTLPAAVEVGLFVCSHEADVIETAVFSAVRLLSPAHGDGHPDRGPLSSALEILDLADCQRRIVFRSAGVIEAPNWTPDGAALVYNGGGHLHRFDLAAATVTRIDTGLVDGINNDHLVSPDGTAIAFSHASPEPGRASVISRVPVGGGTPRRVTASGPSYLHGWSPDGTTLTFTGQRPGHRDYNIYTVPALGGAETRLTTAAGLDDGPEYAPDGATIWFNSCRSGTMQIWRMNADGSAQTQITQDRGQNWFPHLAPDGRSLVFLTYDPEVPANQHPPCKQVTLRQMPVAGGPARILAYVYGGQGTLNVPSWSPDGRRLAFVSFGNL